MGLNSFPDLRIRQGQAHEDQQRSKPGEHHRPVGVLRNRDGESEELKNAAAWRTVDTAPEHSPKGCVMIGFRVG